MPQLEPDEGGPRIGVGVRRALAGEVGQEHQALDAGLPGFGLGRKRRVVEPGPGRISQPAERAGRGEHDAHRVPGPGHCVAKRVHARLRIRLERGQRGEDDSRGADLHRQRAGPVDAGSDRSRRLIPCSGRDRNSSGRLTRHLGRLVDTRQRVPGQLEQLEQLVAPAPRRDVEEKGSRGVGHVDRPFAGKSQPHVVLGQEDVGYPPIDVRLVVAHPEQLRRREAGQSAVTGQRDQALEPDALFDLGTLLRRPLVVPEDRGS